MLLGVQKQERLFPVAFKEDFIEDWIGFGYAEMEIKSI